MLRKLEGMLTQCVQVLTHLDAYGEFSPLDDS